MLRRMLGRGAPRSAPAASPDEPDPTALLALAAWKGLLEKVSHAVGIYYAPSALFVIAFGFILLLLLHFSVAVSRLAEQSKVLAQRLALTEEHQRELEHQLAAQERHEQREHQHVG